MNIILDKNIDAIQFYVNIIADSFIELGYEVIQYKFDEKISLSSRQDIYVVMTPMDALKILFLGGRKIVTWFQGVFSEESYYRNNNTLRKIILHKIEKIILKKTSLAIFVSKQMKTYFEKASGSILASKSCIIPCYNTQLNTEVFHTYKKYEDNVFCYIGSLSKWQKFEETLEIYKSIEEKSPVKTSLIILTKEIEKARELIQKKGILKYDIEYVPYNHINTKLLKAKYGFIIRDDNIVNNVSTPTKLSTYIGNGIIPIYSESISDFSENAKELHYAIKYKNSIDLEKILEFVNKKIDVDDIKEEYITFFNSYYNKRMHMDNLKKKIEVIF